MRKVFLFFIPLFISGHAYGAACPGAFQKLQNKKLDIDERAKAAQCLMFHQLDRPEVAQKLLRMIKDPSEDLFLREDLIEAFSQASLRKKIKVEGNLSPVLGEEEKNAVGSVASGNTNDLLAVTQAVKAMDEILPVTKFESDFFRAINEIALNESNHIMLRTVALDSLDKASRSIQQSGIFDEKIVRMSEETVRNLAIREETISYYSEAALAYQQSPDGRALASAISLGRKLSSEAKPVPLPAK